MTTNKKQLQIKSQKENIHPKIVKFKLFPVPIPIPIQYLYSKYLHPKHLSNQKQFPEANKKKSNFRKSRLFFYLIIISCK